MLLAFLFLWLARPVLRSRTRRTQAITMLMLALTVAGSIHPLPHAVAQTQSSASGATWTTPSDFEDDRHQIDAVRLFRAPKLREGTTVPPTIGRVVNLGRRWAFVPLDKSADQRITPARKTIREQSAIGDETDPTNRDWQPLLLCENQSLQRIVEAARANPNDDTWELSGEILEFFDQNRLLIRTAQRANKE